MPQVIEQSLVLFSIADAVFFSLLVVQIVPPLPPPSILNPPFLAKVTIHDGIGIRRRCRLHYEKYRRGHRDLDAFSEHSNKIQLQIDLKKAIFQLEKMPYKKEMALFLSIKIKNGTLIECISSGGLHGRIIRGGWRRERVATGGAK